MFDQLMENLTMAKTEGTVQDLHLGIFVIGGPGSGKTRLASTCPTPQLVLDFDHGLTTYASEGLVKGKDYYPYTFDKFRTEEAKGPTKKLVNKSVKNIDQTLQLLSYAADKAGPFAEGGMMEDVRTIVLDGFSSMSEYFLYEIMTDRLGLNYEKDKPGFDGYSQLQRIFGNVCELLMKCKRHYEVVGTALLKWEQRPGSSSEGDMIANPDLDGAFRNKIGKVLDEFYFLESRRVGQGNSYFLHSQPTATVPNLKSRSQLPAKIDDPTFDKVFSALKSAHDAKRRK